jgi:hypothetical protein
MKRRFTGGCIGYIHPTSRDSRRVGGCAGWAAAW